MTYRAVFVAADGTEYVLAQGAPSEAAAVEAALAEARKHALIGDEWPHVTEGQLREQLRVVAEPEPIYVTNPWTGALVAIDPADVTPEKLEAMAALMEDDIREELHREFMDDPFAFWTAYVDRVGAVEAGRLWFS